MRAVDPTLMDSLAAVETYYRRVAPHVSSVAKRAATELTRLQSQSEIARLQEQVETLQYKAEKYDAVVKALSVCDGGRYRNDTIESCILALSRAQAAEAERDRLREMILRAADQCDKWVKETYDGGWSTHQVRGQCALAESLRLAAKGEAE